MGAEIVIGFYTSVSVVIKKINYSLFSGIMEQIAMFRSLNDFEEQRKLVDVLIMPNIQGLSIFGFDNVDSLVQRGYAAALPFKKYFRKLADSLNRIGTQKSIKNILDKQSYIFNKINGNKSYSDEQILGMLEERDRAKFIQAIVIDGCTRSMQDAGDLADELIEAHKQYLPGW